MAALTGEKVDIHLMKDPSLGGNHSLFSFDLTDRLGGKEALFLHFPNELCYGYLRFEESFGSDAMPLSL